MTDPKSVELTEAEQRALFTAFTEDSITALRDVIETAKADAWAVARREALLEGDARRRELSRNLERATQLCQKAQAEALTQVERAGLLMYDALRVAEVLVAAGYERRPSRPKAWWHA